MEKPEFHNGKESSLLIPVHLCFITLPGYSLSGHVEQENNLAIWKSQTLDSLWIAAVFWCWFCVSTSSSRSNAYGRWIFKVWRVYSGCSSCIIKEPSCSCSSLATPGHSGHKYPHHSTLFPHCSNTMAILNNNISSQEAGASGQKVQFRLS